jgi:L-Ala-D/L-Glu epimerase
MMTGMSVHAVREPMRRSFGHAAARRSIAEGVILTVDWGTETGVGECVPRTYVTGESVASCVSTLTRMDPGELTREVARTSFTDAVRSLEASDMPSRLQLQDGTVPRAAACAFELALLDAIGRRFRVPVSELAAALGLPSSMRQAKGVRFPISRVYDATQSLDEFMLGGGAFHHVKVKLGLEPSRDVARIAEVRAALGESVPISVDVNMGWTLEMALDMTRDLERFDIAWYEEPLPRRAWPAYSELQRRRNIRVMLDESLCCRQDALDAIEARACQLFNIRISKCGGLIPSLRLAELAHERGLEFQLGVQVGEMGPLLWAGRQFMGAVRGAVAYEAGQADRFFAEPLVDPAPVVDRVTYLATGSSDAGLGARVRNDVLARIVTSTSTWSAKSDSWITASRQEPSHEA